MSKADRKITIKDIAELAGVSIGTVDRVIHNRGEVSAKTREKILKITETLNFQPDILASTLASKKGVRFATIMPGVDREGSFWKAPALGIEKALNEIKHYGVVNKNYLFSVVERESFLQQSELALNDNPDGMLIAPSLPSEALQLARKCDERGIPYVLFNSNLPGQNPITYVGQDSLQSGKVAARLMDYGQGKDSGILIVSIFSFLKNNTHIQNRRQGFIDYFESKGDSSRPLYTLEINSFNDGDIYAALRAELKDHPDIRGIFVTNSRVFHVARFLESEKLTNINLIGYDLTIENIPFLERNTVNFLINQKPVEQSYRGLIALFNKIVLRKDAPREILLPIDIVTRENLMYYE